MGVPKLSMNKKYKIHDKNLEDQADEYDRIHNNGVHWVKEEE